MTEEPGPTLAHSCLVGTSERQHAVVREPQRCERPCMCLSVSGVEDLRAPRHENGTLESVGDSDVNRAHGHALMSEKVICERRACERGHGSWLPWTLLETGERCM